MEKKLSDWINQYLGNEIWSLLPNLIDEKNISIADNYNEYEKRYTEYCLKICDAILKLKPNDSIIVGWKKEYNLQLIELHKNYPIPFIEYNEIVAKVNDAFFRVESFMNGTIKEYKYFGFNDAFTILFNETQKPENFTYNNCKLIGEYWKIAQQISIDLDKGDFENADFVFNDDNEEKVAAFYKDCSEITYLYDDRIEDFIAFSTPDEITESERKFSITDLIKNKPLPPEKIEEQSIKEVLTKVKSVNKIDTENIIESGFIKAFISEYYEDKIYSHYPDKDRLLYVMCNSETEKDKITAKKIKQTSLKIKKLGNEDLSFAYVLSCKVESLSNFIKPNERFDFWLNKFINEYEDNFISFQPIRESILFFCKKAEFDIECVKKEEDFWNYYPKELHPKNKNLVESVTNENELISEIEYVIEEFEKNEYWEIDFNEFEKFIKLSKPLENLFKISELFVQLNRFEMFKSFLPEPQQTEAKTDKLKAPVLGLFCALINKIGIDKRYEVESAEVYCKRICDKYKLSYTDRVRQNYNVNETKKLRDELIEKVLPLINTETQNVIRKYFDTKQPPKQNLYG